MRFLFFLLLISSTACAQHFEWAASGSNLIAGFSHSHVTPEGRLVAAGQYETPSMRIGPGNTELYSAKGSAYRLYGYETQFFIVSYSASGNVDWMISGAEYFGSCRIKGLTVQADGSTVIAFYASRTSSMPVIKHKSTSGSNNNNAGNNDDDDDNGYGYLYYGIIDKQGRFEAVHAVPNRDAPDGDWGGFYALPGGGYIVAHGHERRGVYVSGRQGDVWQTTTTRLDNQFNKQWEHRVVNIDNSCCTIYGSNLAAIGPQGEIFISGSFRGGARPDGGTEYRTPKDEHPILGMDNFESYVGRLSPEGKLLWIKYTGPKILIRDIKTDGARVILGGRIVQLNRELLGRKADTTKEKNAFLASMDAGGKVLWLNTYNADEITAVSTDGSGNIFAAFDSRRTIYHAPLQVGGTADTLRDTYKRVVVASYTPNGEFRWVKYSRAMLSAPSLLQLHNDGCGNVYLTAEMWYVMRVNMRIFDAALVTGQGYGGAPLAAKLRTTLPDEVLQQNPQLVQQFLKQDSIAQKKVCVPIPAPWQLKIFPNPTTGRFTVRATLSYSDQVELVLHNMAGGRIRQLMPPQLKPAGSFEESFDIGNLASGTYLVIMRGKGGAASEPVILAK